MLGEIYASSFLNLNRITWKAHGHDKLTSTPFLSSPSTRPFLSATMLIKVCNFSIKQDCDGSFNQTKILSPPSRHLYLPLQLKVSHLTKHHFFNSITDGALSNAELDAFAKDTNGDVVSFFYEMRHQSGTTYPRLRLHKNTHTCLARFLLPNTLGLSIASTFPTLNPQRTHFINIPVP